MILYLSQYFITFLIKPSLVDKLVVVDISPISVSPGAETMQTFLTVMEQIKLGTPMKRTTARKVVDEQLQAVVKVGKEQSLFLDTDLSN